MSYRPRIRTKLGVYTILLIIILLIVARVTGKGPHTLEVNISKTYKFEFKGFDSFNIEEVEDNGDLARVVEKNLQGVEGTFGIYITSLDGQEKYGLNELETFPAASLYKLILMAAVLKEVQDGNLQMDQPIYGQKSHLTEALGSVDFGYKEAPENLSYTVEEALDRVARISDNFAAIMLSEKLLQLRVSRLEDNKLLVEMTKTLGMKNTVFDSDPIVTTPSDIGGYFRLLADGQVVSAKVSEQIVDLLSKAQINNRIPALLPSKEVLVVHKTGELARVRHDAGIVYFTTEEDNEASPEAQINQPKKGFIIVLMSKELKDENQGIEVEAQLTKDVYEYFRLEQRGRK
ncbi:MAG: hypothetical protein UU73_C0006G0045 [Candidatus Daviesbacteria bacterium GW2011_GWA1_41_61]|uniref:Beta-lactamase class A catalytic domain-containing protein n=1 Tax=Candidatus Daviesbacteria bacterium GW2011_GWA2_40_9 TaxID=1618424 RepID=A0A0G0TYF4_9BACT|nr:MAG: Beta-lactamase [Candidatus Daviesbacteria bacterium GW2011_GWC1_40_9]KKR81908.1 MAG: hypothetical protein UU29_C0021G0003 [Candidatus Daviesbacteria bacterium GW2011_GWA2_40_9]KKR92394.1 MAG: hypothetical protein UU44_C0006G0045 [Candidatus Daviesbacteria bacterium GW2011_GWB1_41_15]KKS14582.1 MAG: hypothetical protein UU73_C0006G0045 [Candidatus Daviesbacteria bacterium GW2011_GWA1_41_61]